MCRFAVGDGALTAVALERGVEPGTRSEPARQGDLEDLPVGRRQQALGMKDPVLAEVLHQAHAEGRVEQPHGIARVQSNGTGDVGRIQRSVAVFGDKPRHRFGLAERSGRRWRMASGSRSEHSCRFDVPCYPADPRFNLQQHDLPFRERTVAQIGGPTLEQDGIGNRRMTVGVDQHPTMHDGRDKGGRKLPVEEPGLGQIETIGDAARRGAQDLVRHRRPTDRCLAGCRAMPLLTEPIGVAAAEDGPELDAVVPVRTRHGLDHPTVRAKGGWMHIHRWQDNTLHKVIIWEKPVLKARGFLFASRA